MARVTLRLDLAPDAALGPGKVRLLESIAEHGSIAAAGRSMGMSYRRAWLLVDELNGMFRHRLVTAQHGGAQGGGAALTPTGRAVVRRYRAIEHAAAGVAATDLRFLTQSLARRKRAE